MPGQAKRRYRTSIKRGEAAEHILRAATVLFASRGYEATSIVDIASAASVARPTVFTAVGTKPAIFRAVLEAAVAGDSPGVPVLEQPWMQEVHAEPDPRRMLRLHARNIRRIGERISDLIWAAECAAESDPDVADVFHAIEVGRLSVGRTVAAELASRTALRGGQDAVTAGEVLNAIVSPAVWRALVRDAGWTPDRWEAWACDTTCRALLPDDV